MRHLPHLRQFGAWNCEVGWEGAAAIANSMPKAETLYLFDNTQVRQGCASLGRLQNLCILHAGNRSSNLDDMGMVDWTVAALSIQLQEMEELKAGKNMGYTDYYSRCRLCQTHVKWAAPDQYREDYD